MSDPEGWTPIPSMVLRGGFEGKEEVVKYTVRASVHFSFIVADSVESIPG